MHSRSTLIRLTLESDLDLNVHSHEPPEKSLSKQPTRININSCLIAIICVPGLTAMLIIVIELFSLQERKNGGNQSSVQHIVE